MSQVGAFALSSPDDTVLELSLAPGTYTAQISGQAGGEGVALGEIYALDHVITRLINLSVRGVAGTGDDVLIPAFVLSGSSRLLLMRTIGPGLRRFGVSDPLTRPIMDVRRTGADTVLHTNQGWTNGLDFAAVEARTQMVGGFPLERESVDSAVLTPLSPGDYS